MDIIHKVLPCTGLSTALHCAAALLRRAAIALLLAYRSVAKIQRTVMIFDIFIAKVSLRCNNAAVCAPLQHGRDVVVQSLDAPHQLMHIPVEKSLL